MSKNIVNTTEYFLHSAGDFARRNVILVVAWVLAAASMFVAPPSAQYLSYIDMRSLMILWSLMLIMRGYMDAGVFDIIAIKLLKITSNYRQIGIVLVTLSFFSSMLITNDVALITLVPFTLFVLPRRNVRRYIIPVLVLETIAANLGSMLTPIGNPQNLYLFNLSGLGIGEFIRLMLPFSAAALALLLVCALAMVNTRESIVHDPGHSLSARDRINTGVYTVLFALAVTSVLHLIPVSVMAACVLAAMVIVNRQAIARVDYSLLMTFVGFFIFTGNMGRVHAIHEALSSIVTGHELVMGIGFSQVISNVPAALLLSDFTDNYAALIQGVNLGGLGTLIASMASLITFKLFCNDYNYAKGVYLVKFTVLNVLFLLVLLAITRL